MGLFDSVKSAVPIVGDDELTLADLEELREEYKDGLEVCDYMSRWAEHNQESDATGFARGDEDFIMYEYNSGHAESVADFPDSIESECRKLLSEFNPRDATTTEEARRCFEEHKRFASKARDVIKDFLDDLDELEEKMERVDYMREADEDFEHDGFEDPTVSVSNELSDFVDERVEEWEKEQSGTSSENGGDEMEKMDITKLVYFIAEELRNRRDEEYDLEFHSNLSSAYPEQTELICEQLPNSQNKRAVERSLHNFGSHDDLPPLKDKHVEFYIIPRVFEGVPPKTPDEIGML